MADQGAHSDLVRLRRGRSEGVAASAPAFAELPPDLARLIRDIESLESIVHGWDEAQRSTVRALQTALDALHKEALVRLIRSLKSEPAAAAALRRAVTDEVVYGVLRHHDILRPSLHERLEAALRSVRPFLASHGGDVELVEVALPDSVTVRLLGSCDGCSAAGLTLSQGVETAIREACPEITRVRQAKSGSSVPHASGVRYVSPFARADDSGWIPASELGSLPPGLLVPISIADRSLLLYRNGDAVACFENACAHLGMPLDQAEVIGGVLTCPHHGFQYDLESGECLTVPGVQLQTHAVRVWDQRVEIKLS